MVGTMRLKYFTATRKILFFSNSSDVVAGPRAKYLMPVNATIKPFLTRPETIFNQIEALLVPALVKSL